MPKILKNRVFGHIFDYFWLISDYYVLRTYRIPFLHIWNGKKLTIDNMRDIFQNLYVQRGGRDNRYIKFIVITFELLELEGSSGAP